MAKIARPEIEIEELTGEGSGILKNVYRSCYARRQ